MDPMPTVKALINACQIYRYYLIAQCTITVLLYSSAQTSTLQGGGGGANY